MNRVWQLPIPAEYRKAPEVTRQRLYLETMERVLGAGDKIILDRSAGAPPLILPLTPFDLTPKPPAGGQSTAGGQSANQTGGQP